MDESLDLPEGTELEVATKDNRREDGPVTPEEIARVLAAMQSLLPLEMPDTPAADLDAWDQKLNSHGIEYTDLGAEDVFRCDASSSTPA